MSLRKLVPSPNAIFMFEAAARHQSFTRAAAEFNVTQSAVSRMIARLETHLSVRLFERGGSKLELTEDGLQLFLAVSGSFQKMEIALEDIRARQGQSGTITLSSSSAFAMHWFMPRFDKFQAAFPEVDLRFQLMRGEPEGPVDDVDLAIRYNQPASLDHHVWPLSEEHIMPVCSPTYIAEHGHLTPDPSLSGHTLVHLSGARRIPWERFLQEGGYPDVAQIRTLTFSDYSLVIESALKDRGIALGWWHVVAHKLAERGLVQAAPQAMRTGRYYNLVASARRPLRRPTVMVRDWLISEMEELRAQTGMN